MSSFGENMKAFAEQLNASIRERGDSLHRVHEATESLLGDAREFLGEVSDEHRARAEELREKMAADRAERNEAVSEMRSRHQEALGQMKAEMHATLTEANRARHEAVGLLHETFQASQRAVAADLAAASRAWREFAASR